jgi:hypothetical protein
MAVTIQKACMYSTLILLIIVLIYFKSKLDVVEEREGFLSQRKGCPIGYGGPDATGKCTAGWSKKCGEDCAKFNCARATGTWIPLDYNRNPYTCQMKIPTQMNMPVLKNPSKTYNTDGLLTTGLQCYLDATRKESTQGQVWKDISGKGRDFKWNKTPLLFNGKYSTVDNVAVGPNGDTFELGNGTKGYGIILYSKTNRLTEGHGFLVANSNSVYGLNSHIPWTDSTVYFDQGWSKNNANVAKNRIQKAVGPCSTFSVWAFVRDFDNSMKIYKDGTLLVSNSANSADPLELKASPWQITVNMDADISKFMVYNTYLTVADVSSITNWIIADEQKQKIARMRDASRLVPNSVPVKLGLQLFLDTNNYVEGRTEWKDQSGNGYDFTWNKAPVIQNKTFLLNGEYALSNKPSKLINIDDKDTYTICWTAKTNTLSQNSVFKLKGDNTTSSKRGIFCHPTWTDNTMYFDQAGCCDPNKQRVSTNVSKYSKEYTFYSIRRTDKERAIFINGAKVASIPTSGDTLNINLDKMIIGRDLEDNFTWFANLKNFMVYNRDLSDKEIKTLYINAPDRAITYNKDGLLTTGLQCYLDATRKESTQGQVWKDISGKGRDFKWNKTPLLFNGKYSTVGNVAVGPNGDTFELGDGSRGYAIVLYSKTNRLTEGHGFLVANSNSVYGLNSHIPWTDSTVYFDQGWSKNNANAANNRIQKVVGPCSNFSVWVFVKDFDNSMKIYKDGTLLVSNSANSADPLELKASPWQIAVNMNADISKFMVYNTYLTGAEVANVTKWIIADEEKQEGSRMIAAAKLVPDSIPVKLGLQLFLDTNNYVEGRTEWKDQSGNGYDFTWNKAPAVVDNSFLLNGEYALSNKPSKLINIDDKDTYTICWTAKTNSLGQNSVFKLKGDNTTSSNRGIFCHPTWTDNTMYFDQAGCCDPNKQRVSTNVAKYSKEYTFYSIRRTDKERAIFINGAKVASIPTSGDTLNINLDKMIIGRDLEDNFTWFANLKNFMVYNRNLDDKEIIRLYNLFNSNYHFKKLDYNGAVKYCTSIGKRLCSASEYCSSGKPINSIDETNQLGPISDYPDGWIQLGKSGDVCKTEKKMNVANIEVAILCCDRKIQPLVINAIHINGNVKTFFKGHYYQYMSNTDVSRPMNISTFKGLSKSFKNGDIDAITITGDPNISLWFKRSHLMVYDNVKHLGNEMEIVEYFSGLPKDFGEGSIDAVATRGPNTEYIMFKKTRYCTVDMVTKNFISAGNIAEKYKSLPRDFQLGYFDCAVYSETPNCSYIMKNNKMIEYNFNTNVVVKPPVDISSIISVLLPPFISKDKACSVYGRLMKLLPKNKYWKTMYYTECKNITMKEYKINLDNYHKIVKRYEDTYKKEMGDSKKIDLEISKYEKLLKDKQIELKTYTDKLLELGSTPCKDEVCQTPPKCKSKSILVYENDDNVNAQQFYQVDKELLKSCMNDANIGENYPGGFNFFKHPKFNEYKKA